MNTPPLRNNPALAQTQPAPKSQPVLPPSLNQPVPDIKAKIEQDNPALRARVQEFVTAAGGVAAEVKPKTEIPPNTDFDIPNPNDTMLTEALIDTRQVDVTDVEKQLFVKALLNDTPIRLTIALLGGQFKVDIRSRSLHEQQRIFDVLNKDQSDGYIPNLQENGKEINDLALQVNMMNKYCMVLMIERVNGVLFSDLALDSKSTLAADREAMHKAIEDGPVRSVQGIRWTNLLNAMRIFETKCAKLSTEANNEDFWKPRE